MAQLHRRSRGRAHHRHFARVDVQFSTLTLTPQQIHDIGLKEVARLEAEMRATKNKANFKGTMAEFFTFLRHGPIPMDPFREPPGAEAARH